MSDFNNNIDNQNEVSSSLDEGVKNEAFANDTPSNIDEEINEEITCTMETAKEDSFDKNSTSDALNTPEANTYSYSKGIPHGAEAPFNSQQYYQNQNEGAQYYQSPGERAQYASAQRPAHEQNPYSYGYGAPQQGNPYNNPYGNPQSYQYVHHVPSEQPRTPKKEKKKREKKPLTRAAAIVICVCCVVLSVAAGFVGSMLPDIIDFKKDPNETEKNSTAVIYRSVETVPEDGEVSTLSEVANLVSDSVVEITTEYVSNQNSYFGQFINEGAGSGVIISEDGYIVTNNHVIYDPDSGKVADIIGVRLRDGTEYEAKLIGRDTDSDIAVIKVDGEKLSAAVWGKSEELLVGQSIFVVGNPLGELGGTVTSGIVSSTSREVEVENVKMTLIQTDAAVNPGNSGGGMFNLKGELIGIVNAKSSGSGVEGLGFAIPSDDALDIVEQLLNYGYVKGKVYLGISFYEANSGYYFYTEDSGILYVYNVEKGYNDDVLKSKDIVLSIDGEEVSSVADVKAILRGHSVGDKLTFSILRNKKAMDVEVTCYEYAPSDDTIDFNND